MTPYTTVASPLGDLVIAGDGALQALYLPTGRHQSAPDPSWTRDDSALPEVRRQLEEYFAGDRTDFTVPLAAVGTPFQRKVWAGLCRIPYGETWSYGRLATELGQPGAARAVGLANGQNPISIVVPCHRVIGADGSLTGYGGGLDAKRWLLAHERRDATLFAV